MRFINFDLTNDLGAEKLLRQIGDITGLNLDNVAISDFFTCQSVARTNPVIAFPLADYRIADVPLVDKLIGAGRDLLDRWKI